MHQHSIQSVPGLEQYPDIERAYEAEIHRARARCGGLTCQDAAIMRKYHDLMVTRRNLVVGAVRPRR